MQLSRIFFYCLTFLILAIFMLLLLSSRFDQLTNLATKLAGKIGTGSEAFGRKPIRETSANLSGKVLASSWCNGRLGNVMSTFATLFAYQQAHGVVPVMPTFIAWLICYYFECKEEVLIVERVVPNWESFSWVGFFPDDKNFLDPKNQTAPNPSLGNHVNIGVYPNNVKYIHKYLPQLKSSFFTLKERFRKNATEKLRIARDLYMSSHDVKPNDDVTFVGIHSRNTDYSWHLSFRNCTLVGEDYFTRAMNVFRKSEKHPLFVIVSDDMNWAKEKIIPVNNDCYFLGTGIQTTESKVPNEGITGVLASNEIGNDLALLTQVNYSIMTYGTFGMWGAMLSGSKKVIMPKGYENTEEMVQITAANMSGWTFV